MAAPTKIICIGRNYVAHIHELQNEVPSSPVVFLKPPSSLISNGESIVIPSMSTDVHHEVELVAEIGREVRFVDEQDALAAVRGYAVGLDMTARDLQSIAKEKRLPWSVSKGFDTFAPLGQIVPAEGIDPTDLDIRLTINGALRQDGNTSLMIYPLPVLIAYVSRIFTLIPGDLIYTGTPAGVGPVADGDHLVATVSGLPALEVNVVEA